MKLIKSLPLLPLSLSQLAAIVKGELQGTDAVFEKVSLDTRSLNTVDRALFIALKGPHVNAHDFIDEAKNKGAVGAVIDQPVQSSLPCIRVKDTLAAFHDLAAYYRAHMSMPVLAVTGSCGKTTVRSLLSTILAETGEPVLASQKSFNNHIGVPLTLLNYLPAHQYAVLELGTNHPGEIALLSQLAKPTIAIVTHIGPAHLENFGTLTAIANEKGQIFKGLTPKSGVAVINQDDAFASKLKKMAESYSVITYSMSPDAGANVYADHISWDADHRPTFDIIFPTHEFITVHLAQVGEHNISNALAAAAAGYAAHLPVAVIQRGLEKAKPVDRRLSVYTGYGGATIIDDSYNANPSSVSAAIAVLANSQGQKIMVLGDMLELGNQSSKHHREIGKQASLLGISQLFCYGSLTKNSVRAFGTGAFHFNSHASLIAALKRQITADTTVLIKGSFAMAMDQVAKALIK